MNRLDWSALMKAGMQGLRLPPDVFWRLSPAELALMLGTADAPRPLTRAGLDALMAAHPDRDPKGPQDG